MPTPMLRELLRDESRCFVVCNPRKTGGYMSYRPEHFPRNTTDYTQYILYSLQYLHIYYYGVRFGL